MSEPQRMAADPTGLITQLRAAQDKAPRMPEPTEVDQLAERWRRFAPVEFHDATLDRLDAPDQQALRAWLAAPTPNLWLFGDVGVGKTYAAFAACRALLSAGRRLRWYPTVELLDAMRPGGALDSDLAPVLDIEFLFLDELGGEKPSDWTAERLYLIVNRRWLEHRPIIITSNGPAGAVRDTVGARTYDRLRHRAVALRMTGESRRAKP